MTNTTTITKIVLDLQLFADAGTLVNTTTGDSNAYDGTTHVNSNFTPGMKTYYNTELLKNARPNLVYINLGKKQMLPARHGKKVEWRRWKKFDKALTPLVEGVIPEGKKFGQESLDVTVQQFGDYATISDVLDKHNVDPVVIGCTEEMGAAAALTSDSLCRNTLMAGTNVMYAPDAESGSATLSRNTLTAKCTMTPDLVHKGVTALKKLNVPKFDGRNYIAVIHPSVSYDLTSSKEWVDYHMYSDTTPIFEGEIGKIRGCRFIESTEAPVIKGGAAGVAIYATMMFGKDAFGVVDPEGMGMQMIIKGADEVGGPLEQFSTVGWKCETATKILYQERMLRIESGSFFSGIDKAN